MKRVTREQGTYEARDMAATCGRGWLPFLLVFRSKVFM